MCTGFTGPSSLGRGQRPCLAADVCRDDWTEIGFGIGCASALVTNCLVSNNAACTAPSTLLGLLKPSNLPLANVLALNLPGEIIWKSLSRGFH